MRSRIRVCCVLLALLAAHFASAARDVYAQADAGAPAPSASPSPSSVGQYPDYPFPFVRGNPSPSGSGGEAGFYLSKWFFIVLLVFFAWVWSNNWAYLDAKGLAARPEFWSSILLLSGLVGFLAVLCIKKFPVGFTIMLLAYAVPMGLYIRERNEIVPANSRILTRRHIEKNLRRFLARFGIEWRTGGSEDALIGPAITFLGKMSSARGAYENRTRQVENSKGFLAAKELVYDAVLRRGTDIHIEPKDDELSIRLRIDGVMYPTDPFDRPTGEAVINIFKVLGGMDITERRRPQDGSFRAEMEGRTIDFRVATQGTKHGEKMSLRILDQSNSVNALAGLGLRKQMQEKVRQCIHQPHGLFLVCGPTGAGKSTTLYAALRDVDSYQQNVITVEDPIEFDMPNVNQIEINTKAGQSFATALRSILRQDPDIVMIGEIRDGETAQIACQAANTGHMVFSTVHANDTITALYRLIELGVEPYMVANSLSAVLAQRLARRLCPECREPYKPSREFLEKLGLPADRIDSFYRAPKDPEVPCENCGGLGYQGRVGIFELLVINDRMRDLIRENAQMSAIRAEARKNGMLYMREEALRLLARGVTSVEEIQRTVK